MFLPPPAHVFTLLKILETSSHNLRQKQGH